MSITKDTYVQQLKDKINTYRKEINELKNSRYSMEKSREELDGLLKQINDEHKQMEEQVSGLKSLKEDTKKEVREKFNNIFGLIEEARGKVSETSLMN